jgi:putative ABC transport system substrate-binding protein
MRRRQFITFAGGAALWPLLARAEQAAVPVIGYLSARSPNESKHLLDAFRAGLQTLGYMEGRNIELRYRWAEGEYDRLPALAADLVREKVAVLVATGGEPSALAAKAATSAIPIGLFHRRRPGQNWFGREPQPARRKRDRRKSADHRAGSETTRIVE